MLPNTHRNRHKIPAAQINKQRRVDGWYLNRLVVDKRIKNLKKIMFICVLLQLVFSQNISQNKFYISFKSGLTLYIPGDEIYSTYRINIGRIRNEFNRFNLPIGIHGEFVLGDQVVKEDTTYSYFHCNMNSDYYLYKNKNTYVGLVLGLGFGVFSDKIDSTIDATPMIVPTLGLSFERLLYESIGFRIEIISEALYHGSINISVRKYLW